MFIQVARPSSAHFLIDVSMPVARDFMPFGIFLKKFPTSSKTLLKIGFAEKQENNNKLIILYFFLVCFFISLDI